MRKLINANFELDLSNYKLSVVRENFWFSEDFFTKYSFPFEIDITDDLDAAFGFITRYNSTDAKTYIECKYYHNNSIEDAILEVEQAQERLSCIVYFGYEQLPNFDKKLSELPLDKFELPIGTDIYEHALTIIPQTYPDVNYNFPQIHTDKIDPDNDEVYFAFEKIINNYKNGAFLINEVVAQPGGDEVYNRNIMQPLPYLFHLLKKIFEDVNLTLSGDILTDDRFENQLLFADVDFATTASQESVNLLVMSEDFVETGVSIIPFVGTYGYYKYLYLYNIPNPGRYRLIGTVTILPITSTVTYVYIKYRSQIIWNYTIQAGNNGRLQTKEVDVVFDTLVDLEPNQITIESFQRQTALTKIVDVNINPIRFHDAEGNPVPTIINKNEVDLTKSVPDMTCGDLVKVIKNWYNYDLTVQGNLAIMNKVENQINYNDAIDLSHHEVKYPLRRFQKGSSYLLKFSDVDSQDYKYLPVFQDVNGFSNTSFSVTDKTVTIDINALPLPLLVRNGVQTAHAFESNNSKPYFVFYDGLTGGLNLCKSNPNVLLPKVHEVSYKKWFDFRINTTQFTWSLRMFAEEFQKLSPKSKVFAFGKYHIIKTINDTEVSPDLFEIELETSTLE